jgi:hypothetical protein
MSALPQVNFVITVDALILCSVATHGEGHFVCKIKILNPTNKNTIPRKKDEGDQWPRQPYGLTPAETTMMHDSLCLC